MHDNPKQMFSNVMMTSTTIDSADSGPAMCINVNEPGRSAAAPDIN
ncbi:MAG: hypothetical protein ABIT47_01180 [Candidatus Paceibacterota bacterium]